MFAIVGTVPLEDFPLTCGDITYKDGNIEIGDQAVPVTRGTSALMAAAIRTVEVLRRPAPVGYLVGDIGLGKGSRRLYRHLAEEALPGSSFRTITFHYLQPIIHWHERLQRVIAEKQPHPTLIADAGFMYVAKMSGQASRYDLFTPDMGELAYLADEAAPHPFYTRGFILHDENRVEELVSRAYQNNNAARFLLVKGKRDYLAHREGIIQTVHNPAVEAMEAMGGTGDTLTGIVSALIDGGVKIEEAAAVAMKANRLAGYYAHPTPASQVLEVIKHIPKALSEILSQKGTSA